jgi:lipoate-protein ligase A
MDWRNSFGAGTLKARKEGVIPDTLWVLRATNPSVTAAFFNDIEKDINLDFCQHNAIPVRRTIGGGGCGFFDSGSVYCVAFFSIKGNDFKTHSGIEAIYRPLNDIQVGKRKFSMAGVVLDQEVAYFILILQVQKPPWDLSLILNVSPEKMADKETKTLEQRTTWLEREAGRRVLAEEVEEACMEGIESALGAQLSPGEITEQEQSFADDTYQRLSDPAFQFARTEGRRFAKIQQGVTRVESRHKVPNGPLIRAVVLIKDNTLIDLLITGSIMATPLEPISPIDKIETRLRGAPLDRDGIRGEIQAALEQPGFMVAGASADDFSRVIWEAIRASGCVD